MQKNIRTSKTLKTLNKKKKLKPGLNVKEELMILDSSISIARGMLATLSLGHKSDWMRKYTKTEPEHLRILLQDVMEEIWKAQEAVDNLTAIRTQSPTPRLFI